MDEPGNDSPFGCGGNSHYIVYFSKTLVEEDRPAIDKLAIDRGVDVRDHRPNQKESLFG